MTLATLLDEGSLVALLNPEALLESDRDDSSSR